MKPFSDLRKRYVRGENPQTHIETVDGDLTAVAVLLVAEARAEAAIRDLRAAGATRIQVWGVLMRALGEAPEDREDESQRVPGG